MSTPTSSMRLSCLKATELIEKNSFAPLTRTEYVKLFTHKLICTACRRYEKQSSFIRKLINIQLSEPEFFDGAANLTLDVEFKNLIISNLENK